MQHFIDGLKDNKVGITAYLSWWFWLILLFFCRLDIGKIDSQSLFDFRNDESTGKPTGETNRYLIGDKTSQHCPRIIE